jgi:hypothetical protein
MYFSNYKTNTIYSMQYSTGISLQWSSHLLNQLQGTYLFHAYSLLTSFDFHFQFLLILIFIFVSGYFHILVMSQHRSLAHLVKVSVLSYTIALLIYANLQATMNDFVGHYHQLLQSGISSFADLRILLSNLYMLLMFLMF